MPMIREKTIQATFREMTCDTCAQGVFRFVRGRDAVTGFGIETRWLHKCSHCGVEKGLQEIYPLIIYKNRLFDLRYPERPEGQRAE